MVSAISQNAGIRDTVLHHIDRDQLSSRHSDLKNPSCTCEIQVDTCRQLQVYRERFFTPVIIFLIGCMSSFAGTIESSLAFTFAEISASETST